VLGRVHPRRSSAAAGGRSSTLCQLHILWARECNSQQQCLHAHTYKGRRAGETLHLHAH
jgi:hypothetical protein